MVGLAPAESGPPTGPRAPVRVGDGGFTLPLADVPSVAGQGPGTPHSVVGLVLAAVAAVAVAVRSAARRRRGEDTD
ncbi:hypothetical protein AB0A99_02710 [Streptomyces fradiae]